MILLFPNIPSKWQLFSPPYSFYHKGWNHGVYPAFLLFNAISRTFSYLHKCSRPWLWFVGLFHPLSLLAVILKSFSLFFDDCISWFNPTPFNTTLLIISKLNILITDHFSSVLGSKLLDLFSNFVFHPHSETHLYEYSLEIAFVSLSFIYLLWLSLSIFPTHSC